jgi:hypothetical protein
MDLPQNFEGLRRVLPKRHEILLSIGTGSRAGP